MKFQELGLKVQNTTNTVTLENGQEVKVKQYIPVSDKIDLIQIAMQKAEEDGIYNQIKLDMHFHLNIVYLYTDIEFSEEDRQDEMDLFDKLESNNVFLSVIGAMAEDEYKELTDYLNDMKDSKLTYTNTAAAVLRGIIQDLPKNAAAAKEILDSFDKEKYQNVRDFAIAANGGRNIVTNQPVNNQGDALIPAAQ